MSFRDNKQFWESFISLYKTYPCLWNVKSKEYVNKQKRNDAYEALVIKCKEICPEANVQYVRKKIDSLRAGFRRELREMRKSKRTGSSADNIYEPTLWYFDLLLFTQDNEEVRPGTSSLAIEESATDDDCSYSEFISEDTVQSPLTPTSTCSSQQSRPREKNKKLTTKDSTLSQKKAKFLDVASTALAAVPPTTLRYEPFGKSVACDLENMEPHQRTIAQKLISDVLYFGKLKRLAENCSISIPANIPQTAVYHHDPYYPHQQQQYEASLVPRPTHTQFSGLCTPVPPYTAQITQTYTQPTQYTPAPISSTQVEKNSQLAERSSLNGMITAPNANELSEFISFNNRV
ncbi:uncharacterized protein [Onthophagus taurus]|uniref:uncharacterized protein n=1 Tax=Onthophagus taurus TaxID=166361 RepID=UPI0039BE509D